MDARGPIRLIAGLALAGVLSSQSWAGTVPGGPPPPISSSGLAEALRSDLAKNPAGEAWLSDFYAGRGYRPLWGNGASPAAKALLTTIASAAEDGLDPRAYDSAGLAAAVAAAAPSPATLAETDIRLSRTFARYVADLHGAGDPDRIFYTEPGLRSAMADPRAVLDGAGRAASLQAYVAEALRMNPIYVGLRAALDHDRARGRRASDEGRGGATRALILANMARVRGLPADLGPRYVLVNAADQTLRYYDHGRVVGSMRVVVGKPTEPTPLMAGMIRYAVARPYWNVPPDLVRDSVAPKVIAEGQDYLRRQDFEALSDWSDHPHVLDPAAIDWPAVAAGRQALRLRQRPSSGNMMGGVKFMFPNQLGVYLHDTPLKSLFKAARRTMSAGCVRLQDAPRLARWLLGPSADADLLRSGPPEQAVDLAQPTPVYILYMTAAPKPGAHLEILPDIYHRDPAAVRRTADGGRAAAG